MPTTPVKFIPDNLGAFGAPLQSNVEVASGDGAIASIAGGHVHITKGSAAALTLAAPYGDGATLDIISETAFAHVVTIPSAAAGGGAAQDVGTFGGAINDGCQLISRNGKWWVHTTRNVTFA